MTEGVVVPDGVAAPDSDLPTSEAPAPTVKPRGVALAVLGLVAVLLIVLDQVSKQLSLSYLTGREPLRLLGGAVYLNLTRNSGAAFSIGGGYTWVFPIIAVVVVSGIIWLARRLRSVPWAIAFGLVIGGAIGNLIDRLFRDPGFMRGQVVDMISLFDPAGRVFPAGAIFNVADSALFCGIVLAIILESTGRHRDGSRAVRDRAAA
jgi:signal peptidase II